jgi:hypothetical protein
MAKRARDKTSASSAFASPFLRVRRHPMQDREAQAITRS